MCRKYGEHHPIQLGYLIVERNVVLLVLGGVCLSIDGIIYKLSNGQLSYIIVILIIIRPLPRSVSSPMLL